MRNGAIDTDRTYPFTGHKHQYRYDAENSGATMKRYVRILRGKETALTNAIATIGPIAVAVNDSFIKNY